MAEKRTINVPQPGFWMVRLVKGGPYVPARIWHDGDALRAEIIDEPVDPITIWHGRGETIDGEAWQHQIDEIAWLRAHRPNNPRCHPRQPVNILNAVLE